MDRYWRDIVNIGEDMSKAETIAELIEYGKLARIKENRRMWYPAKSCYVIAKSGDSINITPERFEYIDRVMSELKRRDPVGREALLYYFVDGLEYKAIARKLKCGYGKSRELVQNTIASVEMILYPMSFH